MIFTLILFITASCTFLSIQSDPSTTTSQGRLAEGIEGLGQQITDLSANISEAFDDLDKQLDNNIEVNKDVGVTLIDNEIQKLENDQEDIKEEIDDLDSQIEIVKEECEKLGSCAKCLGNDNCGWCSSDKSCMAGDGGEAVDEDCEDFVMDECKEECEDLFECDECLSYSKCGWCEDGEYCMEGSEDSYGDCESEMYYHAESWDNYECPTEYKSKDNGSRYNLHEIIDNREEFYEDLDENDDLIRDLQSDKDEIIQEAEVGQETEIDDVTVSYPFDDFAYGVDKIAKKERDGEESFEESLADYVVESVVSTLGTKIDKSEQNIINEISEGDQQIMDEIDDLEGEEDEHFVETQEDLTDIEDQLNECQEEEESEEDSSENLSSAETSEQTTSEESAATTA